MRAICESANISMKINNFTVLNGAIFPALLKLNKRPSRGKDGRVFWHNEIDKVITPSINREDWLFLFNDENGEIINKDGAIAGEEQSSNENPFDQNQQSQVQSNMTPF